MEYIMPKTQTRRTILKSALTLAATPTALAAHGVPKLAKQSTLNTDIRLIDVEYASVCGWIIPVESLIKGEK